jgi:hypothetical protein
MSHTSGHHDDVSMEGDATSGSVNVNSGPASCDLFSEIHLVMNKQIACLVFWEWAWSKKVLLEYSRYRR